MSVNHIIRRFDGTPTVVDEEIEENARFDNTAFEGYSTVVLDKEFISDMLSIKDSIKTPASIIEILTIINNEINNYFYSKEINTESRERTYLNNVMHDEDGLDIGTKMSSIKGKNVAQCSEKSLGAYIILKSLYDEGKIKNKPSLVLSELRTEDTKSGHHAFLLLDEEEKEYPRKNFLFDIENPTLIEDSNKERSYTVGIYTLTLEEREKIIKGEECSPTSLYDILTTEYHDVSMKRIYGAKTKVMGK